MIFLVAMIQRIDSSPNSELAACRSRLCDGIAWPPATTRFFVPTSSARRFGSE
jgi:hypothetical protein